MIELLDNILKFQNYIFGISGLIFFVFNLKNIRIDNPWDKSIDRNEIMINMITNKWFYIPFTILIINLITRLVVHDIYDKKVYKELVSKTKVNPNHSLINFNDFEFKRISKNSRFNTDKVLIISLDKNYQVELKRDIDDTLSYYIFVPKYSEASYTSIAYITKKPLRN